MRLRVLGSSGGEFPGYNPPAFLIDDFMLLDAGTIGAALDEDEQWKIRHILITHAHLDHIRGIPFLADNIIVKNKKHGITVMGISQVLGALKKYLLNDKIWPDFTALPNPERPVVRLKSVKKGRTFPVNNHRVTAHAVNHTVPGTGYVIEGPDGKTLLYTGDTGPTDAIWKAVRAPLDCLLIEVSFPNRLRRMALGTGHLTPGLFLRELRKLHSMPKRIFITHPKPQYLARIVSEIKALRLNNVKIVKTGETYIF